MSAHSTRRGEHPPEGGNAAGLISLAHGRKGLRGVVAQVDGRHLVALDPEAALELERRLLEIGFVEGAAIEILHEGFIGRDPIAVRLDDMRVALRRQEAAAVLVAPTGAGRLDKGRSR